MEAAMRRVAFAGFGILMQLCVAPGSLRALRAPASVHSVLNLSAPWPEIPEWCKALPRPEYAGLERVLPNEPWFEVYKVAPQVFAIYEPHQSEETIGYLVVGTKQALLFDTGMGIADIRAVVRRLTSRPIVVPTSHTHDAHV